MIWYIIISYVIMFTAVCIDIKRQKRTVNERDGGVILLAPITTPMFIIGICLIMPVFIVMWFVNKYTSSPRILSSNILKPSEKDPKIETYLENLANRTTAITINKCIEPPLGCGKSINGFRDKLSQKEYRISGLCQECQDQIFGQ